VTPAEILAQAARRGVEVGLNPAGDGLRLWSDGDPPTDLVEFLKSAKPELVAHLHRRAPFLQSIEAARPPDVSDSAWESAMRGLKDFIANGHGDEAQRLGWPRGELFALPEAWRNVADCGAALLIGDATVTEITPTAIRIKTASGAVQAFYRKPEIDYSLAYRTRLASIGLDAQKEEFRLRALEAVVNLYRSHHPGADIDTAKAAVLAAIASST
jgi:hypothetical protein